MLQTMSADTKKAAARGSSKPQPPRMVPDGLQAPPVPALGNQATLRLMHECDCAGAPDCDCDMGDDKKEKEQDSPRTGLHRAALSPRTPREAPPIVRETLRSTGHMLDPETQAFFEARFGQELSHVRVHTDARASESARAVNALAYTVGHDIVFAAGRFAPRGNEGRRLLAHELAHVVQQRDAAGTPERVSEPLEQDADRMANEAMGAPAPATPPVPPFGSVGQAQSVLKAADSAPACLTWVPAAALRGNQAALRRLQAKLEIGPVDDPLEREADRVADQVMRMPDPALVARTSPPRISRKCAACEEEEKGKVQRKREGTGAVEGEAPTEVREVLGSPGRPLDAGARAFFEPRFGVDFSDVRVHDDDHAAHSAQQVRARAYAVGNHIVFGAGNFAPGSQAGRSLLAHELTHTVQQVVSRSALRRDPDAGVPAPATAGATIFTP